MIVFRGFADLLFRRLIPWPSLFGADSPQLREEDVMGRRRAWYWRKKARFAVVFGTVITVVWLFRGGSWWGTVGDILSGIASALTNPAVLTQVVFVTFLFIANFAILMGPMLLMGISQIRGFEPGDAQWGVKLGDVRGQVEAKEEVRRVVTLWQSGEAFERAGGKRERGLLFLGAPGNRQDDAREGDRHRLQLAVRLHPRLRLRADLHRRRRDHRPLPRLEGEAARPQVGRPVHRLHRRDRRGRDAPAGARRRRPDRRLRAARTSPTTSSSARTARSRPAAT